MRTAAAWVAMGMVAAMGAAGCEGKDAVPVFGPVGLVDHARDGARGPAGPPGKDGAPGAKGDPGPEGKSADSVDGARLRARYIMGEDGSRERSGDWLDTETDEPCHWAKATDGELRCLPAAVSFDLYFSDAACAKFIYRTANGKPPGLTYIQGSVLETKYIEIGSMIPEPVTVYTWIGGMCALAQDDLSAWDFYETEYLPPSFFVRGAVATLDGKP